MDKSTLVLRRTYFHIIILLTSPGNLVGHATGGVDVELRVMIIAVKYSYYIYLYA